MTPLVVSAILLLCALFTHGALQIDASDYAGVNCKLAAIFSMIGFGGMLQLFHYAFRGLLRSPGFALLAVFTIALGALCAKIFARF